MPYVIGVDIDSGSTAAWVLDDGDATLSPLRLGAESDTVPSALLLGDEGQVLVGEAAVCDYASGAHLVRDFTRRVGEPTPILVGDMWVAPEDVHATLARWVVDRAETVQGEPPAVIVVTHPAEWGPYRIGLLSAALDGVGLGGSELAAADRATSVSPVIGAATVLSLGETMIAARARSGQPGLLARAPERTAELDGATSDAPTDSPRVVSAAPAQAGTGRAHFSRPVAEPAAAGAGFMAWSAALNTGPRRVLLSLGIAGVLVVSGAAAPVAFETLVLTADTMNVGARSLLGTLQTSPAPDALTAEFVAAQPGAADPGVEVAPPGQKTEKSKATPGDSPVEAKGSPAAPGAPAAAAPAPAAGASPAAAPPASTPAQNDAPVPVDPAPVDPAPVDPAPVDPAPVDPAPVDPAPVDPAPVDPAPVDPAPVDPAPVDPAPADPAPEVPVEIATLEAPVAPVETTGEAAAEAGA